MDLKLGKSTYIRLKDGSSQKEITLEQVKELLDMYIDRMSRTGEQLEWEYQNTAFPFTIEVRSEEKTKYLFLKATDPLYNYIIIGVGKDEANDKTEHYIQIVLPNEENRSPGDNAKANELAKYMAAYLKAELHLFNGRILYYNPRK